jgi:hypothetical protein
MSNQHSFYLCPVHILATAQDHVLLAIYHCYVTVTCARCQVTSGKPAVRGEGFSGCFWQLPVAAKHGGAADEHLAYDVTASCHVSAAVINDAHLAAAAAAAAEM